MCQRRESTQQQTIGGKKKGDKVCPHFKGCLVVFLINSDRLLVSFDSLLEYAASTPLEAPCCHLVDCCQKGVEQSLFPWDGNVHKVENNHWKEVEEEVSCN